jgi:hypothetical protein
LTLRFEGGFCPALASAGPVCPGIALLLAHCLAARPLPPAYGLGDGAKPPENPQNLPVDALHQLWQDGAGMNESEKQFSFLTLSRDPFTFTRQGQFMILTNPL